MILKGHFHDNLVKGTRPTKIILKGNLKLNLVLKGHFHENEVLRPQTFKYHYRRGTTDKFDLKNLKNPVSRKKTFKKNSYMETLTECGLEGIFLKKEVIRVQTFKNHTRNYN